MTSLETTEGQTNIWVHKSIKLIACVLVARDSKTDHSQGKLIGTTDNAHAEVDFYLVSNNITFN